MIFNKYPSDINYTDVESLKFNKIEESEILDYKEELINENSLLKEITAFANTRGGYLIFGVTETEKGGSPKDINGLENNSDLNLERLEQIILSNIYPRIGIQFSQKISIPHTENKVVLIIKIQEGQNKPHLESRSSRYYKRYNFEAKPMDEHEIEALYQSRFLGMHKIDRYITEVKSDYKNKLPKEIEYKNLKLILGNIFICPLNIDKRIFDTDKRKLLKFPYTYLDELYIFNQFEPSRYGVKSERPLYCDIYCVELHRNGLIHHIHGYGNDSEPIKNPKDISMWILNKRLLETILFANEIYSIFDFSGKVKIIVNIENTYNSHFSIGQIRERKICKNEYIYIEREWDSWDLEHDYLEIGRSIMNEAVNHFGVWDAPMYGENGVLLQK